MYGQGSSETLTDSSVKTGDKESEETTRKCDNQRKKEFEMMYKPKTKVKRNKNQKYC